MIEVAALQPEAFVDAVPDTEFQRLLAKHPLSQIALPDGSQAWSLVRADDVARGLARLDQFATPSVDESVPEFPEPWGVNAMMTLEPPGHAHARRECAPLVEPARLDRLRPALAEVAAERIRALDGTFEAVESLTGPTAAQMGATYLGVSPDHHEHYRRLAAVFMADTLPPRDVGAAAHARLSPRSRAAAFGSPAQAAIELIKEGFAAGSPWAEPEVVARLSSSSVEDWGMQFVTAGTGGTRACLNYAILLMAPEWSAWQARAAEDQGLVSALALEVIRLASPLHRVRRILTRPLELHGKALDQGSTVLLWLSAANRDPRIFEDPGRFDPGRPSRRHFSFGGGPHHCLGQPIAIAEVEEFIRAALDRWEAIEVLDRPRRLASNVVNEISELTISVSARRSSD